ncbi:hypothetical protein EON76_00465 [bacterium]|nr:MAG: hypothetical protein EON76_00465 [bacterium]
MDASLSSLTVPINKFFGKYHLTIFLTTLGLLLAVAVFLLTLTLQDTPATDSATSPETISRTFDNDTIKKIENLRRSDESPQSVTFPAPRTSPFVE